MKANCLFGACLTALLGLCTTPAHACPYCKADATGLATAPPPADDAGAFPVMISGGFDVPSAFYFRGYLQANHGPIFQPYLNVFTARTFREDIVVRPYVSLFHSANWDSENRMADMSDVMLGAVTNVNAWSIDARYAFYTMNPLMRGAVHEFGAKASYDVFTLADELECLEPFSLRPFVGLYGELSDENGTEDGFLNVGLEPSWRFEAKGRKIGMSLPIDWGLSADDYYLDSDGSNAVFGYFSTAWTTSISLPSIGKRGNWFLNTSVQYLHLAADSVQAISGGDKDVWVGKIGVSFVY